MESLDAILESIEKTMNSASQVRKAANLPDASLISKLQYSYRDEYTQSLNSLLAQTDALPDEIGELEIPLQLLDLVSAGQRPEDFNRSVRENTETALNILKTKTEDSQVLLEAFDKKLKKN